METFLAIAKIIWYDECEDESSQREKADYIAITSVADFASAAKELEEYYGSSLISMEIELVEGPYLFLDEENYLKYKGKLN